MTSSPPLGLRATFVTMPLDVLTHIALDTVCISPGPPLLRELYTIYSLVLTSRILNKNLSLRRNPHLYAKIHQSMYNIAPVKRRLGARAVVTSALASELPRRFSMLKRLRTCLHGFSGGDNDKEVVSADLATLYLMMTEDDGKNRLQILDVLGRSGVADLCFALLSHDSSLAIGYTSDIAFIVALMWMDSEAAIPHENSQRRDEIFDFLEPLVLGASNMSSSATFYYFGSLCTFTLGSPTAFARLCTVERYSAVRHQVNAGSGGTCTRPAWSWSARFDDDCLRNLAIQSSGEGGGRIISPPAHSYMGDPFESTWEGAWCVSGCLANLNMDPDLPSQISATQVFMGYTPMQCQLREYICASADNSVTWVDAGNEDEDELARAWFPEDVDFEETVTALRVYDSTVARWRSYEPLNELVEAEICDTILFGETEHVHGEHFHHYKFYGRVRQSDGRVALVRRPADSGTGDLGIWLFHGHIYGRFDLVGEWTNTSTAKDTPAGHGWFHLAKDATGSNF
ncbi:hypothetical protein K439DRAFT_1631004 [Ramaria rubella]|nr:hypothetical protein K439DRAFT_1631004 [Ramaria rubella]